MSKEAKDTVQKSGILSKSFSTLVVRLIGMGLTYLFNIAVAQIYGPEVFGLFALGQMVLMVGAAIAKGGLDISFLQISSSKPIHEQQGELKSDYKKTAFSIFVWGILLTSIGWFVLPYIAEKVFEKPNSLPYLRIAILGIIPLALSRLNGEALRSQGKVEQYVSLDRIFPSGLTILMVVTIGLMYPYPTVIFWLYNIALVFTCIYSFAIWYRQSQLGKFRSEPRYSYTDLIKRGFPMLISGMLFLIMGWTDQFVLAIYVSEESIGHYHIALKIANLTTLALFSVNAITAPKMAHAYEMKEMKNLQSIVTNSANLVFIALIPVTIVIISFSDFFLGLFGESFTLAKSALIILICGQLVNSLSGSVMYLLQMTGNQVYSQYVLIVTAILNLVLNIILVPEYGMEGAAISTAISTAVWNIISAFVVKKRLNIIAIASPLKIRKSLKEL